MCAMKVIQHFTRPGEKYLLHLYISTPIHDSAFLELRTCSSRKGSFLCPPAWLWAFAPGGANTTAAFGTCPSSAQLPSGLPTVSGAMTTQSSGGAGVTSGPPTARHRHWARNCWDSGPRLWIRNDEKLAYIGVSPLDPHTTPCVLWLPREALPPSHTTRHVLPVPLSCPSWPLPGLYGNLTDPHCSLVLYPCSPHLLLAGAPQLGPAAPTPVVPQPLGSSMVKGNPYKAPPQPSAAVSSLSYSP